MNCLGLKMNNRIKELIAQATHALEYDDDDGFAGEFHKELFAEMIIRECISALWEEECHVSDLAIAHFYRNKEKILQHFGVNDE